MMEMEMNAELERDAGSDGSRQSSSGSSMGSTFCALEQDYAKVMKEMKANPDLAAFEAEYTRLFEALYEANRTEEELKEKCGELRDEVIETTQKSYELQKIVDADEETIAKLRQEIVSAMKLADAAHAREQKAQEMIENLRLSITKLNHEVEQKNRQLAADEESTMNKQKEGLQRDRERLISEMETLKQRLQNMTVYTDELERKTSAVDHQINNMQEALDTQASEFSKERKAHERAESEIQQLMEELKLRNNDLLVANGTIKMTANNVSRLENQLKDQKAANDKIQKEMDKLMVKRMNLQTEVDNANAQIEEMSKELMERNKEIRRIQMENNIMANEAGKKKAEKEWAEKKFFKSDMMRAKIDTELTQLRQVLKTAETEIETLKRRSEEDKKTMEELIRERDILAKNASNLKENVRRLHMEMETCDHFKKKMEDDLSNLMDTISNLKKSNFAMEKEKNKRNLEAQELAQQVEDRIDELKMKQVEIFDYKKRLAESDTKFRQQQNLFEAIRADRNTCSKSLIEAQDEIQELKNKLKITNHQIEQLKEDIASKESNLVKEEFLLGKAEKEKNALKMELQSSQKEVSDLRHTIEEMKQEEKRLRNIMNQSEMNINRQKKEMDTIMDERDIIGTQLVRRNDELSLQYNKIKVLNGTISRGESQYDQRLNDIRLLKLEVKKLRTEKVLLSKNIKNMSDVRQEIFHLHRDLAREKMKVTALEEEVQNPLNIHRWRKLEGSDPDTYQLLKKIQILQKRILKMSTEMIAKEKKIKETEKLYTNLQEVLSRKPGPDIMISFEKTQMALRERGKKMKCLVSELNMCESHVNEYKFDFEKMNREMCDLKKKYYALKRKDQKAKESKQKELCEPVLPPVPPSNKKFCGGGFNMAGPTPRNCYALE